MTVIAPGGGHSTDESGGPAGQPTGGPQGGTAVTTAQGLPSNAICGIAQEIAQRKTVTV